MERIISLSEVSRILGIDYIGENQRITGLNLCNRKSSYNGIISYVTSNKYVKAIKENKSINTLILNKEDYEFYKNIDRQLSFLIVKYPEIVFYELHQYLYYQTTFYDHYKFTSTIGENCDIHKTAYIESGVIIGNNVIIGANSIVKKGSIIGNDVRIGCNSVIGSEGFQLIRIKGIPVLAKHVGGTQINNGVWIGDNTNICNSLFEGVTLIDVNAKIDNLVHVAHNCYVGKNVVITAGTVLCGSSTLEDASWIGVNSSILNNVVIGKNSTIGIGSVVTRNIGNNKIAFGVPAKSKD